jgi:sulfide:quinone oxidoreductase
MAVASQLLMSDKSLRVGIVEPSEVHYYQPGWTLAGAGLLTVPSTKRDMKDLMPKKATWIKHKCLTFDPENNKIATDGGDISYRSLVVAPGIGVFFDRVKGLAEAVGKKGVCSNYSFQTVGYTKQFAESVKKGTFVFTAPATPIKCGGAPLKATYLIDDLCRRNGTRDAKEFIYCTGGQACFGVPYYRIPLEKLFEERGVENRVNRNLVEVKGEEQIAVFATGPDTTEEIKFDFLHVVPPMGPLDFMMKSPLSNEGGYTDVNKATMQHNKYPNVFGLGDGSSLPTAKTAAAAVSQATVTAKGIREFFANKPLSGAYNGYAGCPITVSNKGVIMAEFGYDGVPMETLKFMDQRKPSRLWFHMKRDAFPFMYWNGILKGLWRGPKMFPGVPGVYNPGNASFLRP